MTVRVSKTITNDSINRGFQIESAGKPNAKASTSSATGLGQFIEQTWFGTIYVHGPVHLAKQITRRADGKYVSPNARAILDLRKAGNDPARLKLNIDLMARHWEDNAKIMKSTKDGDLYLAHFAGAGTAKKLVAANQNATAVSIAGTRAADANLTIFYKNYKQNGKQNPVSVAELRAWAERKMRDTWEKAGRPDWIGKYYPKDADPDLPAEAEPPAPETFDDRPPVKVEPIFTDEDRDGFDDRTGMPMPGNDLSPDAPAIVPEQGPEDEVPAEAAEPARPAQTIKGDPTTWWVQYHLKTLNYHNGLLDGKPGSKTFAATTGFLTDWNERFGDITPPKNNEEWDAIKLQLKREAALAVAEKFKRPVTKERAEANSEIVDEVAPEAVPAKRNRFTAWIAGIGTGLAGLANSAKEYISQGWNWFTGFREDLPQNGDGIIGTAWGWVSSLPPLVWFGLISAGLVFIAINSHFTVKKIENDVASGAR